MKSLQLLSPTLFLLACCLPVITLNMSSGGIDVMRGGNALAIGWSGIFAGVTAWYANPFWLAGVGLLYWKKPVPAIICGIIAIAIGYSAFSLVGRVLPADESNVTKMTVDRLMYGSYVWMASLVVMPITALLQRLRP